MRFLLRTFVLLIIFVVLSVGAFASENASADGNVNGTVALDSVDDDVDAVDDDVDDDVDGADDLDLLVDVTGEISQGTDDVTTEGDVEINVTEEVITASGEKDVSSPSSSSSQDTEREHLPLSRSTLSDSTPQSSSGLMRILKSDFSNPFDVILILLGLTLILSYMVPRWNTRKQKKKS